MHLRYKAPFFDLVCLLFYFVLFVNFVSVFTLNVLHRLKCFWTVDNGRFSNSLNSISTVWRYIIIRIIKISFRFFFSILYWGLSRLKCWIMSCSQYSLLISNWWRNWNATQRELFVVRMHKSSLSYVNALKQFGGLALSYVWSFQFLFVSIDIIVDFNELLNHWFNWRLDGNMAETETHTHINRDREWERRKRTAITSYQFISPCIIMDILSNGCLTIEKWKL